MNTSKLGYGFAFMLRHGSRVVEKCTRVSDSYLFYSLPIYIEKADLCIHTKIW
jgi:hypothetical protein